MSYMNRLRKRVELLLIDDFGLRNYSYQEANVLYEILEDRYRHGSLIVTSQVRPEGWKMLLEDQVIAEAILDRFMACAQLVEVKVAIVQGGSKGRDGNSRYGRFMGMVG